MASKLFKSLLQWALAPPVYTMLGLVTGLSLAPAIFAFHKFSGWLAGSPPWLYYPGMGISFCASYFIYGMALILIVPFFNLILGARLKPFRGSTVSVPAIPWYIHSCLTLLVRMTFLDVITPTPFGLIYFRLMGMKIGDNVTINTTAISDPSMITIEDKVIVGGTASILGHYGQGGFLVISPVILRKRCTIGLRAILMGGTEVGENAKILAGSFVLPNTKIPAGETWGGIPAQRIEISKFKNKDKDKDKDQSPEVERADSTEGEVAETKEDTAVEAAEPAKEEVKSESKE